MIENWSVNFFLDSMFILIMRPFEVPVQLLSLGRVFGVSRLQRGFLCLDNN